MQELAAAGGSMRLCMDIRAACHYEKTGMGTYAAALSRELGRLACKKNFELELLGAAASPQTDCFFWENLMQAELLVPPAAELFFVPHNGLGRYSYQKGCPLVITVHDLIPFVLPELTGAEYGRIFRTLLPQRIDEAAKIIAVSKSTKEDLIRLLGAPEEKISVIYEGASKSFRPLPQEHTQKALQQLGLNFPYILYVGGYAGRKNVASLLRAFAKICSDFPLLRLILVGKPSPNQVPLLELAASLKISESLLWLENLPQSRLPLLYNGAELLVYPSLYEGFGLPPLEAMACGLPVIAGNNSSLPEVLGEAGLLVDVSSPNELAAAIKLLLKEEDLRATISKNGIIQAKNFSWQAAAREAERIFKKIVKNQKNC